HRRKDVACRGGALSVDAREHFVKRVYHQRSGYWKPDGEGIEVLALDEWAGAHSLLANGRRSWTVPEHSSGGTTMRGRCVWSSWDSTAFRSLVSFPSSASKRSSDCPRCINSSMFSSSCRSEGPSPAAARRI